MEDERAISLPEAPTDAMLVALSNVNDLHSKLLLGGPLHDHSHLAKGTSKKAFYLGAASVRPSPSFFPSLY